MFDRLNLPPYEIKLRRMPDGQVQVYDPQRCKGLC